MPDTSKGTKNLWVDMEEPNTIILLNRHAIKTTSNDLLFYHRLEYLSTLIRETSPCSKWQLTETHPPTPQRVNMYRIGDHEALSPKWGIYNTALPSTLMDLHRRECIVRARGG